MLIHFCGLFQFHCPVCDILKGWLIMIMIMIYEVELVCNVAV